MEPNNQIPELCVVIPAYNEAKTIGGVLESIIELAQTHNWEVIIVDDGSTDNTAEEVRCCATEDNLKLILHKQNRGYGASIKTGIRGSRAPIIATMDSDGQHDPNDLLKLLPVLEDHDLVIGTRTSPIHSPMSRMPGKWFINWLANYLTGQKIPDLNSGFRLFRSEVVKKYLHLCPDGFSFSTTTTLVFLNRGYLVGFRPITIHPRDKGGESTVKMSTGFATIVLVLRMMSLFQPLRVYIPASIIFSVLGFLWGLPYIFLQQGVSVGALLLIITGILLFFFGLLTDQVAQLRLEKYE